MLASSTDRAHSPNASTPATTSTAPRTSTSERPAGRGRIRNGTKSPRSGPTYSYRIPLRAVPARRYVPVSGATRENRTRNTSASAGVAGTKTEAGWPASVVSRRV